MTVHPYTELCGEYESWVAHCRPLPAREHETDAVARKLTKPESLLRLRKVFDATKIPIQVQATIGERECGFDFTKNWGQGDSLTRPSTHVPRGRPPLGAPPDDHFPVSWEYACIDAFTVCDRLNVLSVPAWTLAYSCWKWEGYNGFGPRAHGRRTGYVVGGSNLQQPGKYVSDGVWDPNHWDTQLGCLPVAIRMIELVPELSLGDAIAAVASPSLVPAAAPPPLSVGGALTGAKWVQAGLNVTLHISPPLDVDGSYGKETRAAIRAFQTAHGLPDNGLVDGAFCTMMDAALAAGRPAV